MVKFLAVPYMLSLMIVFALISSALGKGVVIFGTTAQCLRTNTCQIVVESDGGALGNINAFFKTIANFFSIFASMLTFQAGLNPYVNGILVTGFLMLLFFGVYQLIRAN